MIKRSFYLITFLSYFFVPSTLAQTDSVAPYLRLNVSYIGDVVTNFNGGIKTGTTYLGLANVKLNFETEKAHWWKGGQFFINVANTHGGKPSELFVGDFQGVSNIEAGNLTFLYELWFKQVIGKVEFTVGLQDLNASFASTVNGSLFTNSSFGIQSSIADNIPTPIFPLTALGAHLKWKINHHFSSQIAIFDGTPDDFETNPFNIHWKLTRRQGYLALAEFQLKKSVFKELEGSYKIGAYFHEHYDYSLHDQYNGGCYFIADQHITSDLSMFSQIGFSPKTLNKHNHFLSVGLNYKGLITSRKEDHIGFALAYAGIDESEIGSETAIEFTYLIILNKYLYVRPDIQYIINPAGTNQKLPNAFVGFIRFGLNL